MPYMTKPTDYCGMFYFTVRRPKKKDRTEESLWEEYEGAEICGVQIERLLNRELELGECHKVEKLVLGKKKV